MKRFLTSALAVVVTASPLLAHEGAHMHPHATDPVWVPIFAGLTALGLAVVLYRRFK